MEMIEIPAHILNTLLEKHIEDCNIELSELPSSIESSQDQEFLE